MVSAADRLGDQPASLVIEGALVRSRSDSLVDVVNPASGQPCLRIPSGCKADVDAAVASSRCAFEDGRWSGIAPSARKRLLHRFADMIAADAAALDALDAGEMGKPISVALANAESSASLMRFCAEAIDKVTGDVYSSDRNSFATQRRVPRGVVAAIVPWNFPAYAAVLKVAPALAAGNTVVLKPSELSSRSAIRLAQLGLDAGLPPGVLNVVPGLGETVGRALGLHADVNMVAFTGSTDVGKQMLQYAGQSNMKVVAAECGGKSPQIVFDDGIDLDAAADAIARSILINQGQLCSAGSRLLVQRTVEAAILNKIVARLHRIVMGDPLDRATTFGPLVSARQCARVMQYIELGKRGGAELVCGGERALLNTGGFYVEPTVFRNVAPDSPLAQEEIFGPVLAVVPFEGDSDAIRFANSTIYGLNAHVWTSNLSRGMRMAKGIRSSVRIHAAAPSGEGAGYAACSEPFGQSGIGCEGGMAGMETYMRRQLVLITYA